MLCWAALCYAILWCAWMWCTVFCVRCCIVRCCIVCWDATWTVMNTGVCYIVVNCAVWAELYCTFLRWDVLCCAMLCCAVLCYSLMCLDVMYRVLCAMLYSVVLFVCWDATWTVMNTGVCYIVVNCAVWAELYCVFLDELCYAVLFSDLPWCDVPCFVCDAVLCGVVCLLRCNMNGDVHWCV